MIDPDCRDGKHSSCMGWPCECPCHNVMVKDEDLLRYWFPYSPAQQSGHQGDTSADAEPKRRKKIPKGYHIVNDTRTDGITWFELSDMTGWHHGSSSSVLSNLHRVGLATRLAERRGKSGIYVTTKHINGRETKDYNPNNKDRVLTGCYCDCGCCSPFEDA